MSYGSRQYGSGALVITTLSVAPVVPETALTPLPEPATTTGSYIAAVLADAPYAYYKLAMPPYSSVATDSSGNARDAAFDSNGVVTLGASPLLPRGYSVRFATNPKVARTPFTTSWTSFSIEALVVPEGTATTGTIVSKASNPPAAAGDFPFSLQHTAANKFVVTLDSGNDLVADSTTTSVGTYPRDAMYHVVVIVRNSGTCELWVNGVQDTTWTIAFALAAGTRAWAIGGPSVSFGSAVGSGASVPTTIGGNAVVTGAAEVRLTTNTNSTNGYSNLSSSISLGSAFSMSWQSESSGGNGADGYNLNFFPDGSPPTSQAFGGAGGGGTYMWFEHYSGVSGGPGLRIYQRTGATTTSGEYHFKADSSLRGVHDWVLTLTKTAANTYTMNLTKDGAAYVTNLTVGMPDTALIGWYAATGGLNDNHYIRNAQIVGLGASSGFQGRIGHCAIYDFALTGTRVQAHYATLTPATVSYAQSFSYTGSAQTFTVPAGVTALTFDMSGAAGGAREAAAGKGARVRGTIAVTPGEVLQVNVGQQGSGAGTVSGVPATFGGGGSGGAGMNGGGASGGGASDIRRGSYALADRLAVAGGGGGAGNWGYEYGGGGKGGDAAQNGGDGANGNSSGTSKGLGGTQSAGGAAGTSSYNGTAGALGTGGSGGGGQVNYNGGAGGGGGGYYGGGGGSTNSGNPGTGGGGGGGAGSSYVDGTGSGVSYTAGYGTGNGAITLSWPSPTLSAYWESR